MTESNDIDEYDPRVHLFRLANQPLLEDFGTWLRQSHVSEKIIKGHVENIRSFAYYLVLYDYSLRKLDEATSSEIYSFLTDWFPRKALWASSQSMRAYLATFKKFFKWMGEAGLVSREIVTEVLDTLKDYRDDYLAAVAE